MRAPCRVRLVTDRVGRSADNGQPMTTSLPIAISACLLGEAVRYDGKHKRAVWIESLEPYVAWVPFCPEVEIGLGVPRPPIRIEDVDGRVRLRVIQSGEDLSARMDALARARIETFERGRVAGVIFKARSPSCAVADAPRWCGEAQPSYDGPGWFAEAVLRDGRFPVASDEVLDTPSSRAAFLASARAVWEARYGTPGA